MSGGASANFWSPPHCTNAVKLSTAAATKVATPCNALVWKRREHINAIWILKVDGTGGYPSEEQTVDAAQRLRGLSMVVAGTSSLGDATEEMRQNEYTTPTTIKSASAQSAFMNQLMCRVGISGSGMAVSNRGRLSSLDWDGTMASSLG
jgi:hypothetical protein